MILIKSLIYIISTVLLILVSKYLVDKNNEGITKLDEYSAAISYYFPFYVGWIVATVGYLIFSS